MFSSQRWSGVQVTPRLARRRTKAVRFYNKCSKAKAIADVLGRRGASVIK